MHVNRKHSHVSEWRGGRLSGCSLLTQQLQANTTPDNCYRVTCNNRDPAVFPNGEKTVTSERITSVHFQNNQMRDILLAPPSSTKTLMLRKTQQADLHLENGSPQCLWLPCPQCDLIHMKLFLVSPTASCRELRDYLTTDFSVVLDSCLLDVTSLSLLHQTYLSQLIVA